MPGALLDHRVCRVALPVGDSCSAFIRLLVLYRQCHRLAILFASVQECPGHPCHLIGDGHTGLIDPDPCHQLSNPGTLGIGFVSDMADDRAGAMNQQPSDIAIPAFRDAA